MAKKYRGDKAGFVAVPNYPGLLINRAGQVITQAGRLAGLTAEKQSGLTERKVQDITRTTERRAQPKGTKDKRVIKYRIVLNYYRPGQKKTQVTLHHLLALAFLPPPPSDLYDEVIFINGDHTDYELSNLAWSCSKTICFMSDRTYDPSVEQKQNIVGMITGDGWVHLSRQAPLTTGEINLVPVIGFTQVQTSEVPLILRKIQEIAGGGLYSQALNPDTPNNRQRHTLQIQDKRICSIVLQWMAEYGNLKKAQAQYVLDLMRRNPTMRFTPDEAERQRDTMTYMHSQEYYHTVPIDEATLTPAFLAWFIDAEGCIFMDKRHDLAVILVQRSSPELAGAIARRYEGNNDVDHADKGERTTWNAQDKIERLLTVIEPYSIVKKSQIALALEACRGGCSFARLEEIRLQLQQEKVL